MIVIVSHEEFSEVLYYIELHHSPEGLAELLETLSSREHVLAVAGDARGDRTIFASGIQQIIAAKKIKNFIVGRLFKYVDDDDSTVYLFCDELGKRSIIMVSA